MLRRREFLVGSGVAAMAPTVAFACERVAAASRVYSERACVDRRRFCDAVSATVCVWSDESAQQLYEELNQPHATAALSLIGLSSASQQFVVESLAAHVGFRCVFRATHRYQGRRISHRLEGPSRLITTLATQFQTAPAQWPARLATQVERFAGSFVTDDMRVIERHARLARPSDSPGHLLSWILHRAS